MFISFIVAALMVNVVVSDHYALKTSYVQPAGGLKAVLTSRPSLGLKTTQQQAHVLSSPVAAAVVSRRYVEYVPYANSFEQTQPQVIEVDSFTAPVQFLFRSTSGPLLFQQVHVPAQQQPTQHTRSEELPQHLSHEVYKPVVQEVREIIQPFRRVIQEIKPVVEEVRTIVAKGDKLASEQALEQVKQVQVQEYPSQHRTTQVLEQQKSESSDK